MHNDLISVVIPIYNVDKYLDNCILSIVNQSYRNLEIILVDDGSTDSCPRICDEWKSKDKRIIVIHKENGGLSDARNTGIDIASGRYISFIDSDDWISPNMYERMLDAIYHTNSDIACCGRIIVRNGKEVKSLYTADEITVYDRQTAICKCLCGTTIEEAAWDKLYKKSLFANIRYPIGEINEDIMVTPFLLEKSSKVVHVGEALYYYRCNSVGISKSKYNASKSVVIKHIKAVKHYFDTHYPLLKNEVLVFQGRYALSQMLAILSDSDSRIMFKDDFQEYYRMLKKSFILLLSSKAFSRKQKLQACLLRFKLYRFVQFFRKK